MQMNSARLLLVAQSAPASDGGQKEGLEAESEHINITNSIQRGKVELPTFYYFSN